MNRLIPLLIDPGLNMRILACYAAVQSNSVASYGIGGSFSFVEMISDRDLSGSTILSPVMNPCSQMFR